MLILLFTCFQQTPNTAPANPESDGKGPEGKDRNSSKKLKACSGGKAGDNGKVTSGSGNDGATQRYDNDSSFCRFFFMVQSCIWLLCFFLNSDESRSEGTTDTNDETDNHVSIEINLTTSFLCLHTMEITSLIFILTLSCNC